MKQTKYERACFTVEHQWHPYESVASWYVWYSLDNKPAITEATSNPITVL